MNEQNTLTDGFEAIQEFLVMNHLSKDSIDHYRTAFKRLTDYFHEESRGVHSENATCRFRNQLKQEVDAKKLSTRQYRRLLRVSVMLDDYYHQRPLKLRYSYGNHYKYQLSPFYENLVNEYAVWLNVSVNSIAGFKTAAREFFCYLQINNIYNLDCLDAFFLSNFLIHAAQDHKSSMNNVMVSLRKLLCFLNVKGYSKCNPNQLLTFKTGPSRRKVYPAFDHEDLKKFLSTPDRTDAVGIRDYAILLLASFTGIRAIDVANLKIQDIDNETMSIRFIQHKTRRENELPLPQILLAAIDEYLKVRPDADNPYLFQTVINPARKLNDISSIRNVLIKYLRLAGIDKQPWDGKGFHAFRRSMSIWLLESMAKPDLIYQILGHKNGAMLRHYLPLSTESMRKCALDFKLMPLKSEVYR